MAKAVRFHETGGPEVLRYEDVEVGEPGPGQVRLRHEAVGLNFADTPTTPLTLGRTLCYPYKALNSRSLRGDRPSHGARREKAPGSRPGHPG